MGTEIRITYFVKKFPSHNYVATLTAWCTKVSFQHIYLICVCVCAEVWTCVRTRTHLFHECVRAYMNMFECMWTHACTCKHRPRGQRVHI